MKLKVHLVVCADDGHEEQAQGVATFEKDCQRLEHLGLTLAEAKQFLATLQQHLVAQQAATFVASGSIKKLGVRPQRIPLPAADPDTTVGTLLRAPGSIVVTGSLTPPTPRSAGETATLAIGGLGEVHGTVRSAYTGAGLRGTL